MPSRPASSPMDSPESPFTEAISIAARRICARVWRPTSALGMAFDLPVVSGERIHQRGRPVQGGQHLVAAR